MTAYCTACGAPRLPLSSPSVTLAGQPARVGGAVARFFGWALLAGGLILAALVAAVLLVVIPASAAGWVVGGVLAFASALSSWALLRSGRAMQRSGADVERATQRRAVEALAAARGQGAVLLAEDVARGLDLPLGAADALLTSLAREDPDRVAVDFDDQGRVLYRFGARPLDPGRVRVAVSDDREARIEEEEEHEARGAHPRARSR